MNNKTKNRVIFVLPVVVALVVVGVVLFFVMFSSGGVVKDSIAATAQTADASHAVEASIEASGPSCAFDFLIGLQSDVAQAQIASLGRPIRVLDANTIATQDYLIERINMHIDDNGIVQSVDCQ